MITAKRLTPKCKRNYQRNIKSQGGILDRDNIHSISEASNKSKSLISTHVLNQIENDANHAIKEDVYSRLQTKKSKTTNNINYVTPHKVSNNKFEAETINQYTVTRDFAKNISEKFKNELPGTADASVKYRKNKKLRRNYDKKVKDYTGYNPIILTPKEPLLQSKKYRKEARNPYMIVNKKHPTKGQSHGAPKNSVLKNSGLEIVHGTEPKQERKTRYAVEKDSKPDKHNKHSAYSKGTDSLGLNAESDTSPVKKKKAKKGPQFRGAKMIKRDSNESPRQFNF
jgi:hypothetical protein